jgi:hypothetical protein
MGFSCGTKVSLHGFFVSIFVELLGTLSPTDDLVLSTLQPCLFREIVGKSGSEIGVGF